MRGSLVTCSLLLAACASGDDPSPEPERAAGPNGIEIEYVAHASFRLRAADGTELLIDPYASRVWLGYDWPNGILPNAVLITHPHYDHDAGRYRDMPFPWAEAIPIVDGPGTYQFGDFTVTGVEGRHADPYGMEFGQLNTIMVLEAAGLRIVHLGDNGPLTSEMVDAIGQVDVLMMPADEFDHILSPEATAEILAQLQPRVVIPMHYRLQDLEIEPDSPSDLGGIEPWLVGRSRVSRVGGHITTLRSAELPSVRTIMVFEHAPYVRRPG